MRWATVAHMDTNAARGIPVKHAPTQRMDTRKKQHEMTSWGDAHGTKDGRKIDGANQQRIQVI